MKFYNSLTKMKEEFKPQHPPLVSMYVCGLTPYDHAHIGHARTYAAFDSIKRYLMFKGYDVFHIQNITDVEDKILKRAEENGEDPLQLAQRFHDEALKLFQTMNVLPANVYPKVSNHIPHIIALIKKLIHKGLAYETDTAVWFDVSEFPTYGKLSGQRLEQLKENVRIEPDPTKHSPYDFALWKKTTHGLTFASPWGKGRPGWHIECSAMALHYAGPTLDIHGGAKDLIFPHHENEIAQSEGATDKPFVKYWLHTGFLTVNGEKMSKSLGNFITLKDVLKEFSGNVLRLFFAHSHYRTDIDFNKERLKLLNKELERIKRFVINLDEPGDYHPQEKMLLKDFHMIFSALDDDFNTPVALSHFFKFMHKVQPLLEKGKVSTGTRTAIRLRTVQFLSILGIVFEQSHNKQQRLKTFIDYLLKVRTELRTHKHYALSDEIRDWLQSQGIRVKDKKDGSSWEWAGS
jgi:cysteinyl-tRNA synthetase